MCWMYFWFWSLPEPIKSKTRATWWVYFQVACNILRGPKQQGTWSVFTCFCPAKTHSEHAVMFFSINLLFHQNLLYTPVCDIQLAALHASTKRVTIPEIAGSATLIANPSHAFHTEFLKLCALDVQCKLYHLASSKTSVMNIYDHFLQLHFQLLATCCI